MFHDLFKQKDVDTTNKLSPAERKDLLRSLGNVWGGISGAPQCYSIHAGLSRNNQIGDNPDNNLILYSNTAELRKGVLFYKGYSWTSSGEIISNPDPYQRFLEDVVDRLRYAKCTQSEDNKKILAGFYYNNGNTRVYDDFDNLKEAICKAGLPMIGENLFLPKSQSEWKKDSIALSLKPGTIHTSEKYWQTSITLQISKKPMSRDIGQYVLMD